MNGTPPRALRARADEDLALAQRNRRGESPFPAETETRPEAHRWGQGVWGQQCSPGIFTGQKRETIILSCVKVRWEQAERIGRRRGQ